MWWGLDPQHLGAAAKPSAGPATPISSSPFGALLASHHLPAADPGANLRVRARWGGGVVPGYRSEVATAGSGSSWGGGGTRPLLLGGVPLWGPRTDEGPPPAPAMASSLSSSSSSSCLTPMATSRMSAGSGTFIPLAVPSEVVPSRGGPPESHAGQGAKASVWAKLALNRDSTSRWRLTDFWERNHSEEVLLTAGGVEQGRKVPLQVSAAAAGTPANRLGPLDQGGRPAGVPEEWTVHTPFIKSYYTPDYGAQPSQFRVQRFLDATSSRVRPPNTRRQTVRAGLIPVVRPVVDDEPS